MRATSPSAGITSTATAPSCCRAFARPDTIERIIAESAPRENDAFYAGTTHNVYLTPGDPALPEDHPYNRQVVSSKGLIADDQIPADSPLRLIYDDESFRRFLCGVLGIDEIHPYADELSSVNIHFAPEGRELGWHFDNSSFAVTMLFQAAEGGAHFQHVPAVRNADAGDMAFERVTQILDGDEPVNTLEFEPGDLVLFRGRNAIHRVTPTEGDTTRILVSSPTTTSPASPCPSRRSPPSTVARSERFGQPLVDGLHQQPAPEAALKAALKARLPPRVVASLCSEWLGSRSLEWRRARCRFGGMTMGGLFEDVVAFVARADLKVALRNELGQISGSEAQEGCILSAVAVVAALADWTTGPEGQAWLETELPSIDSSLDGVAELRANDDYHRFGQGTVTRLFGTGQDRVIARVAESSRLGHEGAATALTTTAWVTVGHLARRQNDGLGASGLQALLLDEERALHLDGWGAWIDGTLAGAPAGGPEIHPLPHSAVETGRPARATGVARTKQPKRRRWAAGLLVMLAAVIGGAVAIGLWPSSSDDQLASGESDAATPETTGESVSSSSTSSPLASSPSTSTSAQATSTTEPIADDGPPEVPEIVEYSIALTDPQQTAEAAGTVDLELNTVTGEVCYAFDIDGLTPPYAAHVHVGPSGGAGGITVDFGQLDSVDSGCLQAHPADLVAAASRPSARYVEAHDPSGAFTVRGQLGAPEASDAERQPVAALDDRAHVAIAEGTVILRGSVPDQDTADAFLSSYDDLATTSIEVVNQLAVVPGAEPPSNAVVIEDSVFFDVDSTELSERADEVLADIAIILQARPGWTVTAVGHTDSTGPVFHNFSLSLRRASAVQQALTDLGAPQLKVTVQGLGPVAPAASNDTLDGRAENRRIDFVVAPG